MLGDPHQQGGEASTVISDSAGGDWCSVRIRDLGFMSVTVSVDADDGINEFCQTGCRRFAKTEQGVGR